MLKKIAFKVCFSAVVLGSLMFGMKPASATPNQECDPRGLSIISANADGNCHAHESGSGGYIITPSGNKSQFCITGTKLCTDFGESQKVVWYRVQTFKGSPQCYLIFDPITNEVNYNGEDMMANTCATVEPPTPLPTV